MFNIVDAVKFCCIHIRCYYQRGGGGTRAVSVMYGLAAPASDQYNRCTPTPGVRYVHACLINLTTATMSLLFSDSIPYFE